MSSETLEQPKTENIKSMFGKVDRKHLFDRETNEYKGEKIASSYPAYMHPKAIEDLEQSVQNTEESLSMNYVSASAMEYTKRKLKQEKTRLDEIRGEIPDFTPTELRNISNARKDLDKEIAAALFTKSDMELRPHLAAEEARRMSEPCIKVDKVLAARCNVPLVNGKCTRSQAESIRKMALWHETRGEATGFTDELRNDHGSHAGKSNQVSVGGSLEDMETQRLAREKAIEERLKEIENGESKLDDIGFIQSLKEYMVSDEGYSEQEAKRVLDTYPDIALDGVHHRNLCATVNALKTADNKEEIEVANNPGKEDLLAPLWTCPDCGKEMKSNAKGVHKSRWCPAIVEKSKEDQPI